MRGRSHTLKVCYRTSQQIRRAADKLLPTVLRDTDGLEDERRGIISVFDGPAPEVKSLGDIAAEADAVRQIVETWLGEGIAPHEIGLFVRTSHLVTRAQFAIAGLPGGGEMTTAPMSLAKGLEFRAVVMACDEGILPLDERVADAADEAELDDIYETDRTYNREVTTGFRSPSERAPNISSRKSKKRRKIRRLRASEALRLSGAGEGIRTLDPNLGKVVLYP
ncbi:hypothetical protein OCUBac02_05090 [Bosea sp. ANAM02]|nr:hypothetical protein OCUBac02_05090 [Bosea sp. ANAM02]